MAAVGGRWALLPPLLLLLLHMGAAVDQPVVSLEGAPHDEDFIRSGAPGYSLTCRYRAGYDDAVTEVAWLLWGREVYVWRLGAGRASAYPPLSGKVEEGLREDPTVVLTAPDMEVSGVYFCRVTSTKGTVDSEPLHVNVIDIHGNYDTNVELLSNYVLEAPPSSTPAPFGHPLAPSPPSPHCVLLWSFRTPLISPKPHVTCGFYSHLVDDIAEEVSGGVQLHQLPGGRWLAEIVNTSIPVAMVPRNTRLGCTITVPLTSYKHTVKFEDGLSLDHLVDTQGCASLEHLRDLYGFRVTVEDAEDSCRGDHVPTSGETPATAQISCPHAAVFRTGRRVEHWRLPLSCSPEDMRWRRAAPEDEGDLGDDRSGLGGDGSRQRRDDRARHAGALFDETAYNWPLCVSSSPLQATPLHCSLLLAALLLSVAAH